MFLDYYSTLFETENTEDPVTPTQVKDVHFVQFRVRQRKQGVAYGKWMIFKHYDELDEAWERLRTAVLRDELQGCSTIACSTMLYNPSVGGPGPDTAGVICVYTQEHDIDAIGFKLIEMEQHDIKYKTDQDSIDYKYSFNSGTPVSIKTIYWNNGKPSFECEDRPHKSTWSRREDIWRLNVVEAPESLHLGGVDGRWVLLLEYTELTGIWHLLRKMVESEDENFGVIRMVCPPKRVHNSPIEPPELHLQTSREKKGIVGRKLIAIVQRDIVYQYKPMQYSPPGRGERGGYQRRPQRYSAPSREEVLYWNDGEPDYEKVRRKGITKNWRTGEDVI